MADVRRWLGSPSGGAMLLRTQMICWARVASLEEMAAAQWTRRFSRQAVELKGLGVKLGKVRE